MIAKLTSLSLMASYIRNPVLSRTVLNRTYSTSNSNSPLGVSTAPTGVQSLVGKQMPFFKGTALDKSELVDLNSKDYFNNSYGLLVFYPLDFTFVCPSELLGFSERLEEFQKRNVKLLGVSVDSPFSHLAWKQMDVKNGGVSSLRFPLFSDLNRAVTSSFGLLRDEGFAHRASVLVDKSGVVKHVALYDLGLGRSVDEVLRLFDAVQFSEKTGHVCPVNWKSGDKAMEPNFESTKEYLKQRFDK